MSLTLTAAQQALITGDVRKPRQMVKIILGVNTLYLSTGDDFDWEGNTYVHSGLLVSDVKTGKGGIQSCRVSVIDDGHAYSGYVIDVGFVYKEVSYWKVYGEPPYAAADPILQFKGEIVKIPRIGSTVIFDCATKYGTTRKVPSVTLGPPNIHHLPFPGQQVVIGNELYIVEIS